MELKLYSWRYFYMKGKGIGERKNGKRKNGKRKEKERKEERRKNPKVKSEHMLQSIEKSSIKMMKDVRPDFE